MSVGIDFSQILNLLNQIVPIVVSIMVISLVINLLSGL